MAFSPIHFFRKYQKLGMAAVLLMCMISFVVCSGDRGGPQDWFMSLFVKKHGPVVAKIDGTSYYSSDMSDLKQKRQIANDYMKKTLEKLKLIAEKKIEQLAMNKELAEDARQGKMIPIKNTKKVIEERLKRPRFFDGG